MTDIPVTLATAGILGLLFVYLSVRVTMVRARTKISVGEDAKGTILLGDEAAASPLQIACRSQANFAEYVPIALILLGGIEVSGASRLTVEIFAGMLILGRIAHAIGIQKSGPDALRGIGALLTWLVILGLSIEALLLLL